MGMIAKLLAFTRVLRGDINASEAKVDQGGGQNLTADHFASTGDDSAPLPGDVAALVAIPGAGNMVAVGYLDPHNTPIAEAGEKRIYSRDEDGVIVAVAHLKKDGAIDMFNANGVISIEAGGNVIINGVTIDTSGNITTSGAVESGGISLSTHTHGGVQTGGGSTTGPQ